jgi:pSer/pThr/pTyr-binding forkhead associated (FHA) protein
VGFRIRLVLQEVAFDAPEVILGRDMSCDLSIDDDSLSRIHAAIRRTRAGFELVDLGSRNGTWLDGRRIDAPETLHDGHRIRLGTHEMVFVVDTQRFETPSSTREARTGEFVACFVCGRPHAVGKAACATCRATNGA